MDRVAEMQSLREQNKTLQEIGDQYGLSRERVRQIIGGIKGIPYSEMTEINKQKHRIRVRHKYHKEIKKQFSDCNLCLV
jgi:ATP-dependent Clp protease ATP-binding subunit ClpA